MTATKLSETAITLIKEICSDFGNQSGELINVLHKVQSKLGYLPAEVQEIIARELNISVAKVYGVVTFYSFFTMIPLGEHPISICLGTACYVRGGKEVLNKLKSVLGIEVGATTEDKVFSLSVMRCIGACGLAPAMTINKKVYKQVNPNKIQRILGMLK